MMGLSKKFGESRAITDMDLEVPPGQVFGFLGPNGAGKSTTIRLMMGLYRPTAGSVAIFGQDVRRHGTDVRRRIGYLPGELSVYPRMTGREYLDRLARMRGGVERTRREGLQHRFGVELDRPMHVLSKGNRQKIGLVQAFMHDPELLVLDEPTSGLDPLMHREFAEVLEEAVSRGRSVFLSSHDLEEVQRLARRVAIIREGRLVASDSVDALRRRAPRTVELMFQRPVDAAAFADLPGVTVTAASERRLALTVSGEMGEVFERAVPFGIVDVSARSADLEELFLTYYGEPAPRVGTDVG
jgi:ABC-2 type transport system ATP-binding protein